jgi:hypothetical protein
MAPTAARSVLVGMKTENEQECPGLTTRGREAFCFWASFVCRRLIIATSLEMIACSLIGARGNPYNRKISRAILPGFPNFPKPECDLAGVELYHGS